MPSPVLTAILFLINVVFDLYLLLLMIRLILFWVGGSANNFNPLMQVILKLTNPLISLFKCFIPNIKKLETATVVSILLLQLIKYFLVGFIAMGFPESILGLVILAVADSLKLLLDTFFYAILLVAILSWIRVGYSPVTELLNQLSSPIMRPIQRFVPPVAGFDISAIPALILLQLIVILLVDPLLGLGTSMAFS